ncbi:MAG: BatD family protein [Candidatus Omnitrophota bacterium]
MKKYFLIAIFLLIANSAVFAEPVKLDVKVDKDTITIGDRIRYEVIVEYDDGIEVEPQVMGENLGEFEVKDYRVEEPKKAKDNKWISRSTYIVTTFTTGDFTIPPVTVKYKDQAGNEKKIFSEEIKIKVESVKKGPNDKDDIRPLKGPAEIREGFPALLLIILLLLALGAVSGFIYFKRKRRIESMPAIPLRPPEDIAMEELQALLEKKLIEKGMIKEYYIEISDIMRKYIEGRFRIFALDMTTWEICQEMRAKKIQRQPADKIKDFLEDCDLVKFAKYIPDQKEIEEIYSKAKEIIEISMEKMTNDKIKSTKQIQSFDSAQDWP